MSITVAARNAGVASLVARMDEASCSCVNTGQKFCGLTWAKSLFPPKG
jgi:hypothetical protein